MRPNRLKRHLRQLDALPLPPAGKILGEITPPHTQSAPRKGALLLLAALVAVILLSGCVTEAVEHHEATEFFEENDLSPEGLSRLELRRVWKDITTGHFTYAVTAEVLERSWSKEHTEGFELGEEATPQQLAELFAQLQAAETPDRIALDYEEDTDAEGLPTDCRTHVRSMQGETLLWELTVEDVWLHDSLVLEDGILVWGQLQVPSSLSSRRQGWIGMVSDKGKLLWKELCTNGFERETIEAVVPDGEEIAVFSRGDLDYLCLGRFDRKGNRLLYETVEVGNYGIWNAAKLGDDYLVQLGSFTENAFARIVRMDRKGKLTDEFTYEAEGEVWHITDMQEYGGKVYLSAYSYPKPDTDDGRYEVGAIIEEIFDSGYFNIEAEELTKRLREHYAAVLLVCDPTSGVPQTFYRTEGAVGDALSTEDGKLIWEAHEIVQVEFSPATSAFSMYGSARILRCTFGEGGELLRREETKESVPFYK